MALKIGKVLRSNLGFWSFDYWSVQQKRWWFSAAGHIWGLTEHIGWSRNQGIADTEPTLNYQLQNKALAHFNVEALDSTDNGLVQWTNKRHPQILETKRKKLG